MPPIVTGTVVPGAALSGVRESTDRVGIFSRGEGVGKTPATMMAMRNRIMAITMSATTIFTGTFSFSGAALSGVALSGVALSGVVVILLSVAM